MSFYATLLYTMPVPPRADHGDYLYYQAFLRAMRGDMPEDMTAKLRRAMDITAETMQTSPAHIARLLVAWGLRAPREAFPENFTAYVDSRPMPVDSVARASEDADIVDLKDFWQTLPRLAATAEKLARDAG